MFQGAPRVIVADACRAFCNLGPRGVDKRADWNPPETMPARCPRATIVVMMGQADASVQLLDRSELESILPQRPPSQKGLPAHGTGAATGGRKTATSCELCATWKTWACAGERSQYLSVRSLTRFTWSA